MSIGHQRLHGRFSHKAVQVWILVWIPGALTPHVKLRGKEVLVRRTLIIVLKVKEVLTSSLLQPTEPLAFSKAHRPPRGKVFY